MSLWPHFFGSPWRYVKTTLLVMNDQCLRSKDQRSWSHGHVTRQQKTKHVMDGRISFKLGGIMQFIIMGNAGEAKLVRQFCIILTNNTTFYCITSRIIISERVQAILDRSGMIFWHMTNTAHGANKAVIDRRLRPKCCRLGSYYKRSKSSSVCTLACNWYCCAQFIAKPKAACALRFSWSAIPNLIVT